MSRPPEIANHPDRASIEIGLANNVALRVLGKRYGLTTSQLSRYRTDHMPDDLQTRLRVRGNRSDQELAVIREAESKSLYDHLIYQRTQLYCAIDDATKLGDIPSKIRATDAAGKATERMAKLLGEMGAHITINNTQINITAHPEYHQIRTALDRALKRHPGAWDDVFAELEHLEAAQAARPVIEHMTA